MVELERVRTHRNCDKNGLLRWYNDYRLPENYGGGRITVRLHSNADDAARRFNRTENVRPSHHWIPTSHLVFTAKRLRVDQPRAR